MKLVSLLYQAILFLSLSLLVFLQIHNAFNFPIGRGFDAPAHIQNLEIIKFEHRLPVATEGWEAYQPPLYYFLAALWPNLKLVQIFGLLIYFSFGYLLWRTTHNLTTTIFSLSWPVMLYSSLSIGNEFLSAVLIGATIIFYLQFYLPRPNLDNQIILGLLLGLNLLTKATGLLLVFLIVIDQVWLNYKFWQKTLLALMVVLSLTFLVGGWFYGRSLILYHNPLFATDDYVPLANFDQPIVQRNLDFFFNLRGFCNFDLFQAKHYSFLAGTYFSWFYDGHTVLVPIQNYSKAGNLLIILSLPIFVLILWGYGLAIKKYHEQSTLLITYPIFLLFSYVLYNFRIPLYSTVKASFILSLVTPMTIYLALSLEKLKKHRLLLANYLLIYLLILTRHFWIEGWWYKF